MLSGPYFMYHISSALCTAIYRKSLSVCDKEFNCAVLFQLQKLWEDSSSFASDSDKAKIEQIQLQSETGFLEMRLETASRR